MEVAVVPPAHTDISGVDTIFVQGGGTFREFAEKKLEATPNGPDADFYRGKLASARWFATEVLPGLTLARKLVENGNIALMDLPDAAF